MNKGLFIHIIASIIYCLMVMYVVGETSTTVGKRFMICFCYMAVQLIPLAINIECDFYKKNL